MSLRQQSSVRSRSQDQLLFDSTPTSTQRLWPASNSFALVSFIAQRFVHHRIQEWLDVSTKKQLSSWCFFFFTIGATKSHTPNQESLFQSRQRDGWDTDLLAWNSLRREPDESMMSGTRAATAALKMVIFWPLFSTLPLRCGAKRLICLSFVLKQVSKQKMILGWSSPLTIKITTNATLLLSINLFGIGQFKLLSEEWLYEEILVPAVAPEEEVDDLRWFM